MIIKVLFLKHDGLYGPIHLNNGRASVYIGPYKPSRFKNNTFIL